MLAVDGARPADASGHWPCAARAGSADGMFGNWAGNKLGGAGSVKACGSRRHYLPTWGRPSEEEREKEEEKEEEASGPPRRGGWHRARENG